MPLFTPEGQLFVDNTTGQLSFKLTSGPYRTLGPFSGATLNEARAPIINKQIEIINKQIESLERYLQYTRDNVAKWKEVLNSPTKRGQYTQRNISNIRARLAQDEADILKQDIQLEYLKEQLSGVSALPPPSLTVRNPQSNVNSQAAVIPQATVHPIVSDARALLAKNAKEAAKAADPRPTVPNANSRVNRQARGNPMLEGRALLAKNAEEAEEAYAGINESAAAAAAPTVRQRTFFPNSDLRSKLPQEGNAPVRRAPPPPPPATAAARGPPPPVPERLTQQTGKSLLGNVAMRFKTAAEQAKLVGLPAFTPLKLPASRGGRTAKNRK
jgi:hypothetical protein